MQIVLYATLHNQLQMSIWENLYEILLSLSFSLYKMQVHSKSNLFPPKPTICLTTALALKHLESKEVDHKLIRQMKFFKMILSVELNY